MTLHRPANVDNPDALRRIASAVGEIGRVLPVIFPAHPRTQARLFSTVLGFQRECVLIEPLGYQDFLQLWSSSRLVLTDSGGLQEETTALGIPCLTLRENTERPITIEQGTNRLVGNDPGRITEAAREVLSDEAPRVDSCARSVGWTRRRTNRRRFDSESPLTETCYSLHRASRVPVFAKSRPISWHAGRVRPGCISVDTE
jgi:UDP-N-acetylglucosamine 2-epimerase (non-hydrolysing)